MKSLWSNKQDSFLDFVVQHRSPIDTAMDQIKTSETFRDFTQMTIGPSIWISNAGLLVCQYICLRTKMRRWIIEARLSSFIINCYVQELACSLSSKEPLFMYGANNSSSFLLLLCHKYFCQSNLCHVLAYLFHSNHSH